MKTLKLGKFFGSELYGSSGVKFGWAGKIKKSSIVDVVSKVYRCRESVAWCLRTKVNSNWDDIKGDPQPDVQLDKLRLVLSNQTSSSHDMSQTAENILEKAKAGLNIVNLFEKRHGWPLTRLFRIETGRKAQLMYMFYGSKKWIKNPYILSLFMLLVRLPFGWKKYNHMFKTYDRFMCVAERDVAEERSSNADFVKQTRKHWDMFFALYDNLFGDESLEYNWSNTRIAPDSGFHEGVSRLCVGNSYHAELTKRFVKMSADWTRGEKNPNFALNQQELLKVKAQREKAKLVEEERLRMAEEEAIRQKLLEAEKNKKWKFRDVINFMMFWMWKKTKITSRWDGSVLRRN